MRAPAIFRLNGVPWKKRIRHHINLVRWTLDRCAECGHRFAWKGDARHRQNGETFHGNCLSLRHWRRTADERLQVLALVTEVWDVRGDDVRELMANRVEGEGWERSDRWNLAWRVFCHLDQLPARADRGDGEPT